MNTFDLNEHSHRRYNPLTGEWVQVSPHRAKRPWQGQVETIAEEVRLQHDPACYLCPGNVRANGERNPDYATTFAFTNDFAALSESIPDGVFEEDNLLVAKSERGICKVICFSPRHDLTIAEMDAASVRNVIDVWIEQHQELAEKEFINYIQIFENKGALMGCSNPHPHGQIWAQASMPVEPLKKQHHQLEYYKKRKNTLLAEYWQLEAKHQTRMVYQNQSFVVVVPFWAVWPFETMIIPKRVMARITEMNGTERNDFAEAYRNITCRYDNLFAISFPYSAGIHQAPSDGEDHAEWHWHMSFYPPLLRSATVRKFMVGYEMLANPQRDVTPEFSADKLRSCATIHYKSTMVEVSRH